MKWLIALFVLAAFVCALGCRQHVSSEGKILQVLRCQPRGNATPEAIRKTERVIESIPAQAPIMERFEWGRVEKDGSLERIYALVLLEDPLPAFRDPAYRQALDDAAGRFDDLGPYFVIGNAETYLLHDATPDVQTSTHRRLRRFVYIMLKSDATRDQMHQFEEAVAALPQQISSIGRLEWGTATGYDPIKPTPIDPTYRDRQYCLLFTFDDGDQREACLSHPVYQEFQREFEPYIARQYAQEFVAQAVYVPRS